MKALKHGDKVTATYSGKKITGMVEHDGEWYVWTNHKSAGSPCGGSPFEGYDKVIAIENCTNVKIGEDRACAPIVAGYNVVVDGDTLIFGCGDVTVTKKDVKEWVAARLKGQNTYAGEDIEEDLEKHGIELSAADGEILDFLINGKTTAMAKDIVKVANNFLPDFKDGDYFTAEICGDDVSGRVHVTKSGTVYFCHNWRDYDYSIADNRHGYKYACAYDRDEHKFVNKVTEKEVEAPERGIEIGGDYFEFTPGKDTVAFGCGEVTLQKTAILNWMALKEGDSQAYRDFDMIERVIADRVGDYEYDEIDSEELAALKVMCTPVVKKAAKKKVAPKKKAAPKKVVKKKAAVKKKAPVKKAAKKK